MTRSIASPSWFRSNASSASQVAADQHGVWLRCAHVGDQAIERVRANEVEVNVAEPRELHGDGEA